jgi:signal recognition particle subunit SRP54
MFDTLSDRFEGIFKRLRGKGRLNEADVDAVLREIRVALLEADVNVSVVRQVVRRIREKTIGLDLSKSLSPSQQVIKIVNQELVDILGGETLKISYAPRPPTVVLMAGLQGSGKTTNSAKLARWFKQQGRNPLLVGADLQRPAAVEQLAQLGKQIDIPVYTEERSDPVKAVRDGLARAREDTRDVVILDTAGRLHIDEALMDELARVRDEAKPHNVLLVLDAMTGQEAVNVAQAFQERIAFDGVVLTKLDGDARGGAALSVKAVTGKPIKLASPGEKLDQLDWFHPDRMASRILGMGDVLTLIERAEQAVEEDEQEDMEKRMRAGQFTFDDFLRAQKMLKRMGPFQGVLKLIPGLSKQLGDIDVDDKQLARVEAIVLSMTPRERTLPHVIDGSRRQRIARGSGTSVQQVNQLLAARKEMEKVMKQMGKGKMPDLAQLQNGAQAQPRPKASAKRKSKNKRKKKARK